MKLRYLILTLLLLATSVFGQFQPPKDVPSSLNLIFRLEARDMISAAEAMPEDKYDFKPTAGAFSNVRTFAEQLKHVACANLAFAAEVRKQTPPEKCDVGGGPDPSRTKAEILGWSRPSISAGYPVRSLTMLVSRPVSSWREGKRPAAGATIAAWTSPLVAGA